MVSGAFPLDYIGVGLFITIVDFSRFEKIPVSPIKERLGFGGGDGT
jgi:hypothetical protein